MIKEYRLKNNLSQEELAEEIGISNRHLQRLEQNEEHTRLSTFKKIVKSLNKAHHIIFTINNSI